MKKEIDLETAENLIADGKYDKAVKALQKLISAYPDDMRLKIRLGDLYVKLKALAKSVEIYQEVAASYIREKFHLKAIALYQKILKLNPTLVEANKNLGDLYRQVGMTKDALSQYAIVVNHYEQTGQTEPLLELRRKIVDIDPSSVTSRIRLAEIYQKDGQTEESLREYERVARGLIEKNDRDRLIEIYEKILFYRPNDTKILIDLCQLYMKTKGARKAIKRLESAPPEVLRDADVKELAIDGYLKMEQREKVRRLLKELCEQSANEGDQGRAKRLYALGQAEFGDDDEYLAEIAKIFQETGLSFEPESKPLHQEDLEKTMMVRLDEFPLPDEGQELAPAPSQAPARKVKDEDLEKTTIVRLDDIVPPSEAAPQGAESKEPEKRGAKEAPKKQESELDETALIDLAELEKQFKKKK